MKNGIELGASGFPKHTVSEERVGLGLANGVSTNVILLVGWRRL